MNEPLNPVLDVSIERGARAFEPYTVLGPLEALLEQYLGAGSKYQMSQKSRHGYVRFTPWIMAFFLPLHFCALLLLLGVSAVATVLGHPSFFSTLLQVALFVVTVISLPGMFARTRRGWAFAVYGLLIGTLMQLAHFSIVGLLLHVLFLWLAFQAKYEYS
jgi:hypothetical protein